MAKIFLTYELQKFRSQFREWYGSLSVLELAVNVELARKIKNIETLLEEMMHEKSDY